MSAIAREFAEVQRHISRHISPDSSPSVLGDALAPFFKPETAPTLVSLALIADLLRVVHDAIEDEKSRGDVENGPALAVLCLAARAFARTKPGYADFSAASREQLTAFLDQHRADQKLFGYSDDRTKWAGLSACEAIEGAFGDSSAREKFHALLLEVADGLADTASVAGDGKVKLSAFLASRLGGAGEIDEKHYLDFRPGTGRLQLQCGDRLLITYSHTGWYNNAAAGIDFARIDDEAGGIKEEGTAISRCLFDAILTHLKDNVSQALLAVESGKDVTLDELDLAKALPGDPMDWAEALDCCGRPRAADAATGREWGVAVEEGRAVTVVSHPVEHYVGIRGDFPHAWTRLIFDSPLPSDRSWIRGYDNEDVSDETSPEQELEQSATEMLFDAVLGSDPNAALRALDMGADVNHQHEDHDGKTPVLLAIASGNTELVSLLASRGADLSMTSWRDDLDAWLRARIGGNAEVLEAVVAHGGEPKVDAALSHAVANGKPELAAALLEEGANPNGEQWGTPPLLVACRLGSQRLADLLIDCNADVHVADNGENAYVAAYAHGYEELARHLVSRGCAADDGYALLHSARMHNVRAITRLLESGVDVNARREVWGEPTSALQQVIVSDDFLPADSDSSDSVRFQAARVLLDHGSDPKAKNSDGQSMLSLAIKHHRAAVARELLDRNADADVVDEESGGDAFLTAAMDGDAQTVVAVARSGAKTSGTDKNGSTALHRYVSVKDYLALDHVKALVAAGAPIAGANGAGESIVDACEKRLESCEEDYRAERIREVLDFLRDPACERLHGCLVGDPSDSESAFAAAKAFVEILDDHKSAVNTLVKAEADGYGVRRGVEAGLDDDSDMRKVYVAVLGQLGFGEQQAEILRYLYDGDWRDDVKAAIVEALERNGFEKPLDPSSLDCLDEGTAKKLVFEAASRQDNWIPLDRVKSLSLDVAKELAGATASLSLDGVEDAPLDVLEVLARHRHQLSLNGLQSLSMEAARALSSNGEGLHLNGLTELDVEAAEALCGLNGFLSLNGLTRLTADLAECFSRFKGHTLSLDGLETLTTEAALGLSGFAGNMWLDGLGQIAAETAEALVGKQSQLTLSGLTELSLEVADALARHEGELLLNGLSDLAVDVAFRLREHGGTLKLGGLEELSAEAAEAFLDFEYLLIAPVEDLAPEAQVPLLLQRFRRDPLNDDIAFVMLSEIADQVQIERIVEALVASLPPDPEASVGVERIAAGRTYALLAYLLAEGSPERAFDYSLKATSLDPSLQHSPWGLLADLKDGQGDGSLRNAVDLYNKAYEAGSWPERRALYDKAISAAPTFVWPYNNIAWHLATAGDPGERDGAEAVRFASQACELDGYQYWSLLDTLAAAYFENREYGKAAEIATLAVERCPGDTADLESLLERCRAQLEGEGSGTGNDRESGT